MIGALAAGLVLSQPLQPLALLVSAGRLEPAALQKFRLEGTANDVRLMADLLHHRFGVPKERILVLGARNGEAGPGVGWLGEQATAAAIKAAFEQTVGNKARRASHRIFFFSGHGAKGGQQEMLVGVDGKGVMDWELRRLSEKVRDEKLTLVMDSCHAAGGAKGEIQARFGWPKALLSDLVEKPRPDPDRLPPGASQAPRSENHALLAAVPREDRALEVAVSTKGSAPRRYGLFTLALYQAAMNAPGSLSISALIAKADDRIRKSDFGQRPLLLTKGPRTAPAFGSSQTGLIAEPGALPAGILAGLQTRDLLRVNTEVVQVRSSEWYSSAHGASKRGLARLLTFPNWGKLRFHRRADKGEGLEAEGPVYEFTVDPQTSRVTNVTMPSGVSTPLGAQGPELRSLESALELRSEASGLDNPDSPLGLTMAGSWAAFGDVTLRMSGTMGETVTVRLATTQDAYLALFSLEPDGTIAWHYPLPSDRPSLSRSAEVPLVVTPPEGQSLLVALASEKPIPIPASFWSGSRADSKLVEADKAPGFFAALMKGLRGSHGVATREDFDSATILLRAEFPGRQ